MTVPFLVAVNNPDPEKVSAYECGFNAFDDARMKFDCRYYLVAILFIMINKMIAGDVTKFMKVFIIILINYGFAMYICYPRVGDIFVPMQSPEFNDISASWRSSRLHSRAAVSQTPRPPFRQGA